MANQILGLLSSDKFAAEGDRFFSHRRKILHLYPSGGAPLTGLLSMIPSEPLNDSIYIWYEKRYQSPRTLTRGTNPLTTTAPSTGDANDGTVAAAGAINTTTLLYLKVATTADLRPGLVLQIEGGTGNFFHFWVKSVVKGVTTPSTNGYVSGYLSRAITFALGDVHASGTAGANAGVRVIGSAMTEGMRGGGVQEIGFKRPYAVMNTTQIFRTPMKFSGSVLKMGLKYDKTGPYKEKAKDTIVDHMTQIERSLLFGKRTNNARADLDGGDGEDKEVRTFSGILEFLELWDAGATGLQINGTTYAPYGHKAASTNDNDDQKRIINNADGILSVKRFERWAERISRYHSKKTKDKLVIVGSQALLALTEMFRLNSNLMVKAGDRIYGLDFVTWTTAFGNFHFMTHPLFNEDPFNLGKWMMFMDPNLFALRPLADRDTRLLKNRQNPGDDFRKDEYLTELGLEAHLVEGNMLVKNITRYVDES